MRKTEQGLITFPNYTHLKNFILDKNLPVTKFIWYKTYYAQIHMLCLYFGKNTFFKISCLTLATEY